MKKKNKSYNSIIYNKRRDNSNVKLSTEHYDLFKKLSEGRESSLSAMLTSGRKNPVGIIAILNHFYGWSSPYVSESFGGYSYTKRSGSDSGSVGGWQEAFKARLSPWRKLKGVGG